MPPQNVLLHFRSWLSLEDSFLAFLIHTLFWLRPTFRLKLLEHFDWHFQPHQTIGLPEKITCTAQIRRTSLQINIKCPTIDLRPYIISLWYFCSKHILSLYFAFTLYIRLPCTIIRRKKVNMELFTCWYAPTWFQNMANTTLPSHKETCNIIRLLKIFVNHLFWCLDKYISSGPTVTIHFSLLLKPDLFFAHNCFPFFSRVLEKYIFCCLLLTFDIIFLTFKLIISARFGGSDEPWFQKIYPANIYLSLNTCLGKTVTDLSKALMRLVALSPVPSAEESRNPVPKATLEALDPNDESSLSALCKTSLAKQAIPHFTPSTTYKAPFPLSVKKEVSHFGWQCPYKREAKKKMHACPQTNAIVKAGKWAAIAHTRSTITSTRGRIAFR